LGGVRTHEVGYGTTLQTKGTLKKKLWIPTLPPKRAGERAGGQKSRPKGETIEHRITGQRKENRKKHGTGTKDTSPTMGRKGQPVRDAGERGVIDFWPTGKEKRTAPGRLTTGTFEVSGRPKGS